MSLPPKSKFRLMILVGACVALAAGVLVLKAARNARESSRVAALRQIAMEAYARGEYAAAMPQLSKYLEAKEQSPEQLDALFAFADCRRRFAIPGKVNAHLGEAIQRLDDYLASRSTDERALRLQLRIQTDLLIRQRASNHGDVLTRAKRLLDVSPNDVEALTARATALARRPKPNLAEAQLAVQKLLAVAPKSFRGLVLATELKLRAGTPPAAEVLKQLDAARASNPADPAHEAIAAHGYLWAATQDAARRDEWWRQGEAAAVAAAGRPPVDAELTEFIVGLLDDVGRFKAGTDYLLTAANKMVDADLERSVVRRLWQSDRYNEVLDRTAKLDTASAKTPADLLAYRALSLLGRAWLPDASDGRTRLQNEADAIATSLASRAAEPDAQAWAVLLKTDANRRPVEAPSPSTLPAATTNPTERNDLSAGELARACRDALNKYPLNGLAMARLGDALYALGETEPATQQWAEARRQHPDWAYPLARRASALLEAGVNDVAVWFAEQARRRSPDSRAVNVLWAQAAFSALPGGAAGKGAAEALLGEVETIQKLHPFDPGTLAIEVSLLARVRGTDAAAKRVEASLAAKPPLPQETLLGLHSIDRSQKLGFADRIDAAIAKMPGGPSSLAVRQAYDLLAAGKPNEGLKVLLEAQRQQAGEADRFWMLTVAGYRDRAGDPDAGKAVAALADAFPQDLFIQGQVLRTATIRRDRALWEKTIARLKTLTGDGGARWKAEKAMFLLAGAGGAKDRREAIDLLTPLVEQNKSSFDLRRMLGRALLADGQFAKAAEQLQEALRLRPNQVIPTLELAEALRLAKRPADAAAQLGTIPLNRLSIEQQATIAQLYEQLGETAKAVTALERLPAGSVRDAKLGRLYRAAARPADADGAYRRLLEAEAAQPGDLYAAADFFASQGKLDVAQQCLDRLQKVSPSPAVTEVLLGQFQETYGSADDARAHLTKATELTPRDALSWRALAGFLLRTGKADEAERACDAGLAAAGQSPELSSLKSLTQTVRKLPRPENVSMLVTILTMDPGNAAASATLKVLAEAQAAEAAAPKATPAAKARAHEQLLASLAKLAADHPDFWPLQEQVIRQHLRNGRTDEAAAAAEKAMSSFPRLQEPARLAAEAYFSLGRWNDVERVAILWRQRSGADTIEPDVMLAEVLLARRQPALAIGRLEPDVRANPLPSMTTPATGPTTRPALRPAVAELYRTYGRALVEADRTADADKALKPLLSLGSDGWATWLAVAAAHKKADAARSWIEQAATAAGSSASADDQLVLAQAWLAAGQTVSDIDFLKRAAMLLEPLTAPSAATGPATLSALRLHGLTAHYLGDYATAERCWRAVRQKRESAGASDSEALNNLAYVLLVRGDAKDRAEATALAKQAVANSPAEPSFIGTLARAQSSNGQRQDAIAGFRKVLAKDAASVEAKLGLAEELAKGEKPDERAEARRLLTEVGQSLERGPLQPPEVRKQFDALKARIETADNAR